MMIYHEIGAEIKAKCAEMYNGGMTPSEIYRTYFHEVHPSMKMDTFRNKCRAWAKKAQADTETLSAGTYEGFTAHGATVQVDGKGNITQAWIKQSADSLEIDEIIEKIKEAVEPVEIKRAEKVSESMLEIPLFDMHFGVATFEDYTEMLLEILEIIEGKNWEEINLIVGQDMLHNNDFRGHTAKGTQIEKVNIPIAWADAWSFWTNIIEKSLENSKRVFVRYSKGNHDECLTWAFFKALEAKYPQAVFDDSLKARKVFTWRGCFIGYGHIEYTKNFGNILQNFIIENRSEFAKSKIAEIHTGHYHHETTSTDKGIVIRRLSSGVPVDEWSDNNGFTTSHKRFQIFEYEPGRLRAVYYV